MDLDLIISINFRLTKMFSCAPIISFLSEFLPVQGTLFICHEKRGGKVLENSNLGP